MLAAVLLASASLALAQPVSAYPTRAVRVVVPFAPGGPSDTIARLVGQRLAERLGHQFVVENRTGAGGNVGVALAAKAAPDGHTVLVTTTSLAVNVTLSANPGYEIRELAPVVNVAWSPNMIVAPAQGARSLGELVAASRARGLTYGSPGTGTTPHLTAEYLFKNLAGLEVMHVPYKGAAPAVAAGLAGEVPAVAVALAAALPHLKTGRLRGLAVTSTQRVTAIPEVPTVREAGFPAFEDYTWVGVFVPAGTPQPVVARLNGEVNAFLDRPEVRERLEALGFEPVGGSATRFAAYLQAEVVKWAKVVRETGAKVE
ncbi:MAG TPA: tripartite tricarboxylate transporter substrate-binding protein [Burkholderiales bacterium]|nr:tripartite tricarboxylate transporter substrate-binding protein [Burkholderiales bacterium]